MRPIQIERNREFLKDLRANPKKSKSRMRNAEGGRCCLCVALDTANRLGADLPTDSVFYPPAALAEFYGWTCEDPHIAGREASKLNYGVCGREYSHAEIADAFEETFPELKEARHD